MVAESSIHPSALDQLPKDVVNKLRGEFPNFAEMLIATEEAIYEIKLGATSTEIEQEEKMLGVPLPHSFKVFLQVSRQISLDGCSVGLSSTFFHDEGEGSGMLCFGDFSVLNDGDQALFNTSKGLINGEYPVSYYDHEGFIGQLVRPVTRSFGEFIEQFATGKLEVSD